MKRFVYALSLLAAVAIVQTPSIANACGVCMGQTGSGNFGEAMNSAMFLMLGFIGSMLAGISAVGYSIVRRSQQPLPPHAELAEMIGSHPNR